MSKESVQEYAVYQGDEFMFIDTLENCAKRLKIKETTLKFYTRPSYMKRVERSVRDRIVVVKV